MKTKVLLKDISSCICDGDWIESKDQSIDGEIRLIQTGNIGIGRYLEKIKNAKYINVATFKRLKCTAVFAGDILVSRLPDPIGRACLLPKDIETAITAVDCTIIRLNQEKCVPMYFVYYTQSQTYYMQLRQYISGTTRNRISRKNFEKICLELPGIEFQQNIVSVLDKASELIDLRKQQLAKMDRLIKSKFIAMFGDPVINEKGWTQISITNICKEIVDCINKTAPQSDVVTPYKMIRTSNVKTGKISLDSIKYVDKITYEKWIRRSVPQRGDLILTREAPMGEVGIIDFDDRIFLGQRLMQYRCDTSLVNPVYLLHYMQGKGFQNQIERLGKGSTVKHLTVPDCYNLDVVTPPVHLQNHFAAFVDKVERQKAIMQASLAKLEINYKALLQQYFG